MRRGVFAGSRGARHTSEKKSKEKTCAERGVRRIERAPAHAKEGKVGKRRVPGDAVADERERLHTPERKSKEMTCSERRSCR